MKKLFATLLVVALVFSALFTLVACEDTRSDVAKAIDAAQKMSQEELEAAAKEEMQTVGGKFVANSLTSGVSKTLAKFIEKYDWLTADNAEYVSRKGSEFQEVLNAAANTNSGDAGDFVMIQDAAFVYSLYNAGFLRSYVPSGNGFSIDKANQKPLVGVTFNKIFYHNSAKGDGYLQNVWQLTTKDGKTLKKLDKISYQSPLTEDINMSFLVMLTAPANEKKLKDAYKSYFGEDYKKVEGFDSIGYYFVSEFIKAVTTWHSSDTSEVKKINDANHQTGVYFAGLAKVKDYNKETGNITDKTNPGYWENVIRASGYNYEVEGFNGFVYNMWTLIPDTAKHPYTACLFIRYLLSEEGYKAGFNEVGYYSANTLIASTDGTTLKHWNDTCLSEDPTYLAQKSESVSEFIKQQLSLAQGK